jgi:hypothetical protein
MSMPRKLAGGERQDRDQGPEEGELGDRPAHPADALSPRVAERAVLQFPGEYRRPGEHREHEDGGDADQHAAVLPPGDPEHPPPRHWRQLLAGFLTGPRGQG